MIIIIDIQITIQTLTYRPRPNIKRVGSCKINKTHFFLPIAMRFVHLWFF